MSCPAAPAISCRPTSVEPVKLILRQMGFSSSSAAISRGPADHELEHAGRQAHLVDRLGEHHGAQRRSAGRLEDHRAAGGQRRGHLAHGQDQGKIPGRNCPHHADRRAEHQVPLAGHLVRHHAAIGPAGLAGKPAQVVDGHGHFGPALRQRLAVFQGDRAGDFFAAVVAGRRRFC